MLQRIGWMRSTMDKYEVMLYPRAYRDIDEEKKIVYVVTVQYQRRDI